ncbi:carcinine transporter-like [Amblyomma americanum]
MDASSCAASSYASSTKRAKEGSIVIEDSLLDGFVPQYSLAGIQESVYIVLGHGAYQRRFLTCGILCVAAALFQFLAYQLIGRPVDHWCQPPEGLAHLSAEAWKNLSIPVEADGSFSQCTMYDPSELDSLLENRTAVPCHKWDYDIADKRDSIVSLFDLVCERRRLYDLSSLSYVVGYTFLAPVAGFLSDRVGRRPVLLACAFVLLLSSVGTSVAATYASLVVTRIVAVSAGSATYILTFILLHEVTGNAWRSLFTLLHTAVAATVVPPLLHAVSLLEPRWLLAQGLLLVPTAMSATWCCLQEESPVWLLTTGNMRDAEVSILRAAQLNGVDMNKARATLTVIMTQLGKIDRSHSSAASTSAAEGIIETVKMRRRAVSVFIARFTLSALYFGVLVRDRATALRWHAAHVFLSTAYYAATYWAMTKWGLRDTLAALLAVVCSCALAEAAVISRDYNPAVPFVHAGMKVAVSAALGVALCYVGDIFPTHIRSIGVSLSIFFGGAGTLSSVSLITLAGRNANAAFSMFAAFTTLLSIVVVHWLPEVFIEKPKKAAPIRAMTEMERKEELKKSLSFFAGQKKRRSQERQSRLTNASAP